MDDFPRALGCSDECQYRRLSKRLREAERLLRHFDGYVMPDGYLLTEHGHAEDAEIQRAITAWLKG